MSSCDTLTGDRHLSPCDSLVGTGVRHCHDTLKGTAVCHPWGHPKRDRGMSLPAHSGRDRACHLCNTTMADRGSVTPGDALVGTGLCHPVTLQWGQGSVTTCHPRGDGVCHTPSGTGVCHPRRGPGSVTHPPQLCQKRHEGAPSVVTVTGLGGGKVYFGSPPSLLGRVPPAAASPSPPSYDKHPPEAPVPPPAPSRTGPPGWGGWGEGFPLVTPMIVSVGSLGP